MVKINFLDENKKINVIDAKDGSSLLEVAKKKQCKFRRNLWRRNVMFHMPCIYFVGTY